MVTPVHASRNGCAPGWPVLQHDLLQLQIKCCCPVNKALTCMMLWCFQPISNAGKLDSGQSDARANKRRHCWSRSQIKDKWEQLTARCGCLNFPLCSLTIKISLTWFSMCKLLDEHKSLNSCSFSNMTGEINCRKYLTAFCSPKENKWSAMKQVKCVCPVCIISPLGCSEQKTVLSRPV